MNSTHRSAMIVFDYCEVIALAPGHDELNRLAQTAGLSVGTLLDRYWRYRADYDVGAPAHEYWSLVTGRTFGHRDDPDLTALIEQDIACWTPLDPETTHVLDDLAAADAHLVLLSNLPRELAEAVRRSPVAGYFRRLVFSAEIGVAKPDSAAFETVLALEAASAASTVFVDDRADNTCAAAELGMDAIQFISAGDLREALRRRSVVGV